MFKIKFGAEAYFTSNSASGIFGLALVERLRLVRKGSELGAEPPHFR